MKRPTSYADVFAVLMEEEIISDGLGKQLVDMTRFRHRLVHHYSKLDPSLPAPLLITC